MELKFAADGLTIKISNASPHQTTDVPTNATTYRLNPSPYEPTSRHVVEVADEKGHSRACVLIAGGGATTVHAHSALVQGRNLIIAVGPRLCALGLPDLDLRWNVAVDQATCFGVHYSSKHNCFISHGELEIARVALDGSIVWTVGGKDIFTEALTLHDDYLDAIDFNHEKYRIEIESGRSSIVE